MDRAAARQAAIDDFLAVLDQEKRGEAWVGRTPNGSGPVVFGGIGIAITIRAACRDAPEGSRLHSLHAHFLRPVRGGAEIVFRSDVVKAGRTFCIRQATANGSSDRRTGERGQNLDRGVSGKCADRAPSGGRAKIGPDQVPTSYHSGTVRDARRLALVTTSGFRGTRRRPSPTPRRATPGPT